MRARHKIAAVTAALLLGAAVWHAGQASLIYAKAALAQVLLQRAWAETRTAGMRVYPWRHADTWPIARLRVRRLAIDQFVLADASPRTLAFGPGWHPGSVPIGTDGLAVISGHRDTHFRFLENLRPGDLIEMDLPANHVLYRVTAMQIIDSRRKTGVVPEGTDSMLALVTCYPFDAIAPGGPLRYIVLGERVGHIANSFALGYHSAHGV